MELSDFLADYTRLEEKYGENFKRLTAIEQKLLIAYAKTEGWDKLKPNLYEMRPYFLPS
jgi:hypothetical protein